MDAEIDVAPARRVAGQDAGEIADDGEMYTQTIEVNGKRVAKRYARRLKPFDSRSFWGKRRLELIASFTAEMGREIDAYETVLIRNVAAATCRLEQLQDAAIRGQPVDDEEFSRLNNVITRLIASLRAKSTPPKAGPSLTDLLAAERS